MLTSLALLFLLGLAFGSLCSHIHLPPLFGMILAGICLGPHVLGALDETILSISAPLRQFALVIILLRAGLALELNALKRAGRPAMMLCFVPASLEIIGCMILAPLLFGVTRMEGAIIGSVLAAVSPAVVVPRMLSFMKQELGTEHAIPQMIIAGSSVDDIFVIAMLTFTTGLASGENLTPVVLLGAPISILLGFCAGLVTGCILVWFFRRRHMRDSIKVLIILSVCFLLIAAENQLKTYGVPFSGMFAIMTVGLSMLHRYPELAKRLSGNMARLWIPAELLLFTLVGAAVDPRYAAAAGLSVIALILGALLFRMVGVVLSVAGTSLTPREQLFTALAYTPKATVQAAVGGIPLALGLSCGNLALTVAVLSILMTAPLGAFLIDKTAPHLLAPSDKT